MKKTKTYLGQRRVKHTLGRVNGYWVVPRMLREYFSLRTKLGAIEKAAKIRVNTSYGAVAGTPAAYDSAVIDELLEQRRMAKRAHHGLATVPEMRRLVDANWES